MLKTLWRRWQYRREERRRRQFWQRCAPEVQAALLVTYIADNPRLRKQLRRALRLRGDGKAPATPEVPNV
jgi:hypothetical protein